MSTIFREAAKRAFSYTENMGYDDFPAEYKTQDAVMRNLEIVGEATKHLSHLPLLSTRRDE